MNRSDLRKLIETEYSNYIENPDKFINEVKLNSNMDVKFESLINSLQENSEISINETEFNSEEVVSEFISYLDSNYSLTESYKILKGFILNFNK